jgi:hypothetical protein
LDTVGGFMGGMLRKGKSDPLRDEAMEAIRQGADPAKVKARYKKKTGKDL